MKYIVTKYEEIPNEVFVRIESTECPVAVENHLTSTQISSDANIVNAMEHMVAELYILVDEYKLTHPFVSNIIKGQSLKLSDLNIEKFKKERL